MNITSFFHLSNQNVSLCQPNSLENKNSEASLNLPSPLEESDPFQGISLSNPGSRRHVRRVFAPICCSGLGQALGIHAASPRGGPFTSESSVLPSVKTGNDLHHWDIFDDIVYRLLHRPKQPLHHGMGSDYELQYNLKAFSTFPLPYVIMCMRKYTPLSPGNS